MFCNLNAEMARKGMTGACLAEKLGITPTTLSLKLSGKSDFTLRQATVIKKLLNVDIPLEILFQSDDKPA